MNRSANDCEHRRENLALLAGNVLTGPERTELENHLASCHACQTFFTELKSVAAPLAGWEKNFAHLEPDQTAQIRWAKALRMAAATKPAASFPSRFSARTLWTELVWPCRLTWAGLAAVWIVLLTFNFSHRENGQAVMATAAPSSGEMRLALREQRRLIDEIIGPGSPASPAEPPRRPNNQPRSERRSVAMA